MVPASTCGRCPRVARRKCSTVPNTQPALLAASIGVWRAWNAVGGPRPSVLAGHSLGEYTALVAAGALSLHDGAHLGACAAS